MAGNLRHAAFWISWLAALIPGLSAPALAQTAATAHSPLTDLRPYAGQTFALVRNTSRDAPNRIDLVLYDPATKQTTMRRPTSLQCERMHFARQTIFCLGVPKPPGQGGPAAFAVTDMGLKRLQEDTVPTGLLASRARVSPDARYASSTMFVTGHAYGSATFSTEAMIIELSQRKMTLPPLEYWTIMQGNDRVNARDLNLWGVTFNPKNSDEFYVTAAIGRKTFLAKGSIGKQRIELVRPDMECPSFSPDGTRLAFKKRNGRFGWLPAVLDLATQTETVFTKSKNVDDQIEWLDNHTLLYEQTITRAFSAQTDLVQLDIRNPLNSPRQWLANAGSPALARP